METRSDLIKLHPFDQFNNTIGIEEISQICKFFSDLKYRGTKTRTQLLTEEYSPLKVT